jgi:N-dimethylarginine dimethylaminohydrolase
MTPDDPANIELAQKQWRSLVEAIESAGGAVETIAGHPDLPDMVFTANLGVMAGNQFVPASMKHAERRREPELAGYWADGNGRDITHISPDVGSFEGMGDALPFGSRFIAGYGPRSTQTAWTALSEATGWPVTMVELPDDRFYHVDLVFSPLSDRHALIAPLGLTAESLAVLEAIVPEPILLTDEEATSFSANSIVVDGTVIMPACSDRLRGILMALDFEVVVLDLSEFLKAGGAVRCLTLPLDLDLAQPFQQNG